MHVATLGLSAAFACGRWDTTGAGGSAVSDSDAYTTIRAQAPGRVVDRAHAGPAPGCIVDPKSTSSPADHRLARLVVSTPLKGLARRVCATAFLPFPVDRGSRPVAGGMARPARPSRAIPRRAKHPWVVSSPPVSGDRMAMRTATVDARNGTGHVPGGRIRCGAAICAHSSVPDAIAGFTRPDASAA